MKIVFNALSARLGGGQTYLINLFQFVPFDKDLEIRVFVPSSLKLPDHPRIRRVQPAWPTENSIVRALWGKWGLPGILKAEKVAVAPVAAVAAVAQGDKFDWEDVSRKTWSELLALAKLHKVGV